MMKVLLTASLILVLSNSAWAQSADSVVGRLMGNPALRKANAFLDRDEKRVIAEMLSLESAPDASRFASLLKAQKVANVETDHWGSVTGFRSPSDGPVIVVAAHLSDPRALAILLALVRALDVEQLHTETGLILLGLADRHTDTLRPALDYILRDTSYKDRIRGLVMLETSAADHVSITPKTIDSKFVQYAFGAIKGMGMKPHHKEELTDRETAMEFKIPSIAIGCGYSTPKGAQTVLTTILAIAGWSQSPTIPQLER